MVQGHPILKILMVLVVLVFGVVFANKYFRQERQAEFLQKQEALRVKSEADEKARLLKNQSIAMQDAIDGLNQEREKLAALQAAPKTDDKVASAVSATQPILAQNTIPQLSDVDRANQKLAIQVAAMEKEQAERDAIAKANRLKFKTVFDKLMALNEKWDSNEELAGNIGRVGLAAPIQRMQDVKADLSRLETFGCLTDLKAAIGMNMSSTITAYINFAGGYKFNGATATRNEERRKTLDRVLLTCG